MVDGDWSMRQWATDHDKRDDERFQLIYRVLVAAAAIFVAVSGWSLKEQYGSLQAQLQAIHETQAVVKQSSAEVERKVQSQGQAAQGN